MPPPQSLAAWLDPTRAALLVYDMQIGIVSQLEGGPAIVAKVAETIDLARGAGIRIAYCRHLSLPKPWMGMFATRMAMAWQRTDDPEAVAPWFLRDAPGVAIVPELAPRPEDMVFDKLSMSAFEGTWLAMALRDAGLQALILCGVATEIGIEPTCRHAADLGIVPIVVRDACGHGHAEAAERSFAALEFTGDAILTTVGEVRAAVAESKLSS